MANTQIKLLRGTGFPTGFAYVASNAGSMQYAEPWVNTAKKQLWVDNVVINPHLTIAQADSDYLSLAYSITDDNEVLHTLTLDESALSSYVLGNAQSFGIKYTPSTDNATEQTDTIYTVNGQSAGFLRIGTGISYDPDTNTISTPLIDSFLSGVAIIPAGTATSAQQSAIGASYNANKTYMEFTFTTKPDGATPVATTIYVDVTSFYDDTDTTTKVTAPSNDDVVVTLTSNSGIFTSNVENTYQVAHKTITTTPSTDTGTATNGGTVAVIDSITVSNGHVTGYNTKTVTLPTAKEYSMYGDVNGTAVDGRKPEAQISLSDDASTPNVNTVTIKHEAQTSGVGSMVMFKESSTDVLEMQITVIDGGTF